MRVVPKAVPTGSQAVQHRWRFYATAAGEQPVLTFLREVRAEHQADAAAIAEEMEAVQQKGARTARKLSKRIYEIRVDGDRVIYRVLFASQASKGRILLALHGFSKKTQKTPPHLIDLAEARLADWEQRGELPKDQR
jgi:phage-related protein